MCAPVTTHTHTTCTEEIKKKKKKATNIHTGDFHVCVRFSETGDFTCLYKEKRKNDTLKKQNQMFKTNRHFFPSLSLCPLCRAVMWLLYSISFLDIFHALNVVSLWRLDAHWKIYWEHSHLAEAEVQVMPQLCILDSNIYPPRLFVEGNETCLAEFSWNVDVVDDSCSWIKAETNRHLLIFLAFFSEITSWWIFLWLGLLTASMLNANDTCNSVIGYKNSQYGFFSLLLHQGKVFYDFLLTNSFAFLGQNGYKYC